MGRPTTIKVTPNFTRKELQCACCEIMNIPQDTLRKLQKLRDEFGMAMKINSACRCPDHNDKVGGSLKSKHICTPHHSSCAFDIDFLGRGADLRFRFISLAMKAGFKGIGLYESFIHIDDRDEGAFWKG